jgi:hypothetical protein
MALGVLVCTSLLMRYIHGSERERSERIRMSIKSDIKEFFIARACLSHARNPEKWDHLQGLFAGTYDPCDSDDEDELSEEVEDHLTGIRSRCKLLQEYESSPWSAENDWWFLTWIPGVKQRK